MTSEGMGEMFEGYFADMCANKIPLVSMEGQAEGQACADPGARTPIGTSTIFVFSMFIFVMRFDKFNLITMRYVFQMYYEYYFILVFVDSANNLMRERNKCFDSIFVCPL